MSKSKANSARRRFISRIFLPLIITMLVTMPFLLNARHIIRINLLHTIDNTIYDAKIKIMRSNKIDPRVVIVDIDDASLLVEGQWPWSRNKMARLVDKLFNVYGVRAIGFDIVFAEQDRVTRGIREVLDDLLVGTEFDPSTRKILEGVRDTRDTDAEFAAALASGSTVMGYIFTKTSQPSQSVNTGTLPEGMDVNKLSPLVAYPYEPSGYLANLPTLQSVSTSGGYFDNPLVDSDGVFRRLPLLQYYQGKLYESLGMALLRVAEGLPAPALGTNDKGADANVDFVLLDEYRIPVDDNLAVLVPYRGRQGSFPYVSATDILHATASIDTLFDTMVLIGTTAPGLFDMRSTPVDSIFAGVEIHANLISGILDRRIWQKPDWGYQYDTVAIVLAALLLALSLPLLSPVAGAFLVVVVISLGVVLNFVLAFGGFLVLPIASFVSCSFIVSLFLMGLNVVTERRKKRYLSRTFAKYVPQELVAQFEKTESEVTLEGESRDMTIMFSDVRDFTSISEHLPPQELTQLMNDYLTPITRVIHEHHGNVDKYIGDAVMAFWGAPIENPGHAQDALEAAIGMQDMLRVIRHEFKRKGWPELRVGIGLNTGVVNIGNMGSEYRTAYTVMGDVVNLASRLEGLCKLYVAEIIVSENMVNRVTGYCFRELDRVRVKGKEEPITLFEPVGREAVISGEQRAELDQYHAALSIYRGHDWSSANTLFKQLVSQYPASNLYQIYLGRCAEYMKHAPPPDWDGVYQLQTK